MKTVDLVYFNAGGGHRASALALQEQLLAERRPWQVRLVNLFEVLDPKGSFRQWAGFDPEEVYNRRLARGWTLGLGQELKLLQGLIRFSHATLCRTLQQHWLATEPDLVVSLVPNFNRAIGESLAATLPGVPFVTVMTDMADLPPSFWIEPGVPQHLVCGTAHAAGQALSAGVPPARIFRSSGMLIRPAFYEPVPHDRAAERRALGLDPQRPTGVVMFGGQGSAQMAHIAALLPQVQLIHLCGHNAALVARLQAMRRAAPQAAIGFTREVPRWMALGDFFIGKPGPGCLSEALHMGLPVITFDNAWTMPQERYNARWVREQQVGLVLRSVKALPAAVASLVANLDRFRERVAALDNRAIEEVPGVLAQLLEGSEEAAPPSGAGWGSTIGPATGAAGTATPAGARTGLASALRSMISSRPS